jgi:hypothetical protein
MDERTPDPTDDSDSERAPVAQIGRASVPGRIAPGAVDTATYRSSSFNDAHDDGADPVARIPAPRSSGPAPHWSTMIDQGLTSTSSKPPDIAPLPRRTPRTGADAPWADLASGDGGPGWSAFDAGQPRTAEPEPMPPVSVSPAPPSQPEDQPQYRVRATANVPAPPVIAKASVAVPAPPVTAPEEVDAEPVRPVVVEETDLEAAYRFENYWAAPPEEDNSGHAGYESETDYFVRPPRDDLAADFGDLSGIEPASSAPAYISQPADVAEPDARRSAAGPGEPEAETLDEPALIVESAPRPVTPPPAHLTTPPVIGKVRAAVRVPGLLEAINSDLGATDSVGAGADADRVTVVDDEDLDRPLAVPRVMKFHGAVEAPAVTAVISRAEAAVAPVAAPTEAPPPDPIDIPAPVLSAPTYSSEDWRSNVRGSAVVSVESAGTVYRADISDDQDEYEPISVAQRLLRFGVIAALIIAVVLIFLYSPAISAWFNS